MVIVQNVFFMSYLCDYNKKKIHVKQKISTKTKSFDLKHKVYV